ncbi:MAG: hypothetical protein LIO85_08075 [Rikenellaceae bacterium]|nr:hypothetical protein [Rikenellaceae bacterium]
MIIKIKIRVIRAVLFVALAFMTACSNYKTIPDKTLTNIFKEVFIANAYIMQKQGLQPARDSLDVYRPILDQYGYSVRDLEYTLANFSKRKSVKLSDVVDRAFRELEAEESEIRYRASMLDSLDARAQRAYSDYIVRDSSIVVRTVRDTSLLRIAVPVREGIYEIGYHYLVDSTDQNRQLRTTFELSDADGKVTGTQTSWMTSRRRSRVDQTVNPVPGDSLLTIRFANYSDELTRPNLKIDSVNIIYKPYVRAAHDSLDRIILPYRKTLSAWQ